MLRLELDWAADTAPELGPYQPLEGEPIGVVVEKGQDVGPAGHPTVVVYSATLPYEPAHHADMRLDGWLRDVYGADEETSQELRDLATDA